MAAEPEDLAGDGPFTPPTPIGSRPATGVRPPRKRKSRAELRADRDARDAAAGDVAGDAPPTSRPATAASARKSGTTGAERARNAARVSQSKWMTNALGFFGRQVEGAGMAETRATGQPSAMIPFARALQFNAPIAGATFDDAVRGTWFDKKTQPMLSRGNKFGDFFKALGFPGIVLAMQLRPELYEFLGPMAFDIFEENIESMGPMIEKKVTRDRKVQSTIDKAVKEGALPQWQDPDGTVRNPTSRDMFESFFAPVTIDYDEAGAGDGDESSAPTE